MSPSTVPRRRSRPALLALLVGLNGGSSNKASVGLASRAIVVSPFPPILQRNLCLLPALQSKAGIFPRLNEDALLPEVVMLFAAEHHSVGQAVASHVPGTNAYKQSHGQPVGASGGVTGNPTSGVGGAGGVSNTGPGGAYNSGPNTGAGNTTGGSYGSNPTGPSSGTTGHGTATGQPTAGQKIASLLPGTEAHKEKKLAQQQQANPTL